MELENKYFYGILLGIALVVLFITVFPIPYTAIEVRVSQRPYADYTYECAKYSFWTGRCTDWDKNYFTRYREVRNEIPVTKYATLWQRMNDKVDYYYEVRE